MNLHLFLTTLLLVTTFTNAEKEKDSKQVCSLLVSPCISFVLLYEIFLSGGLHANLHSLQAPHLRGTTRKLHAVSTNDLSALDEILQLHDESETELSYKQMDSHSSMMDYDDNSTLSDDEIKVLTFNLKVPSFWKDGKNSWQ